jgi:hypothetical protein
MGVLMSLSVLLCLSALPVFQAAAASSPKEDVPYPQCFDFSSTQSVSGDNYEYLPTGSTNGTLSRAVLGQLIEFKCASVVCPNPPTPNCYYDPSVCTSAEWCMLESQILWGPWAFGANGETPGASGHAGIQCADAEAAGMSWWYDTVCSNSSSWGPFENVRGRCVPWRTDQQSCQPELREGNALFGPTYPVRDNGNPFVRPLRCAPGLVCTGDVEPTPNTCVPVRPPNVCFQGPWWNSTWCKIGGAAGGEYTTGLPQQALEDAAASVILQLPQEKLKPANANFWYEGIANRTRDEISRVIETLWPEVYRANTTFPLASIPDPRVTGPPYTAAWNATAAAASSIMNQTPRVWSAIHTLIHNALDPMPSTQIWASRALAVFLAQNFQCPDCRGEFEISVLSIIGLPPSSSSRQDHQKWWWRAHNMVSEHTSSTRGGLPWLYLAQTPQEFSETVGASAGNTEVLKCQNPFFLPYEDAVTMWKIE